MKLQRAFARYFNSGWVPGTVCFGLLAGAITAIAPATVWTLPELIELGAIALASAFLIPLPIAFGIFLGSTIWNLAKRRWWRGGLSCTLLLLFLGSVTLSAVRLLIFVRADAF